MAIRKTDKGWFVDIQPGGREGRKRYRKTLPTRAEALEFEAFIRRKYTEADPWKAQKKDLTRLSELIQLWYDLHGQTLKDATTRLRSLQNLAARLGDPLAADFDASAWARYRSVRLQSVKPNTINHEQAYLAAVYSKLISLGEWRGSNPFDRVQKIKLEETELSWLTVDQIHELLAELEGRDAHLIAEVCLSTGARWSEAEGLLLNRVRSGKVYFVGTKSGHNRAIPVSEDLFSRLTDRLKSGRFNKSYSTFSRALERTGISLPKGQRTHVLRHTFASHFVMNGGHILTLQKILGHSDIKMTMRYAHLAPEHLSEAVKLNPMSKTLSRR